MGLENISNSSTIADNSASIALFTFIVQGIGITCMGTFGIAANILGIFILSRPKLRSSITPFLLGLSTFDLIFLLLCVLIYALVSICEFLEIGDGYRHIMDPENSPWLVTLNDTAQTASVYFTIAIAIERYVVIQWPLASRSYCTYKRCAIYSIVVLAFAILYQLQRLIFTQAKVVTDHSVLQRDCPYLLPENGTSEEGGEEELGADDDYEQYFFRWPYMTFMMILPTVTLILLNSLIWLSLHRRTQNLKIITSSKSGEERERSITVMLLVVVLVFLMCQIVFYTMAILEGFYKCQWEATKFYLIPVDLFLITTNSSVNFLIYCVFGSKFREQLYIVLRQWTRPCFPDWRIELEISERSTKEEKSSTAL